MPTFDFEVVTLNKQGKEIQRQRQCAEYFTENLDSDLTLDMVAIPDGSFMMGSPESEEGRTDRESPQHQVTIAPFHMGKYPVTQAQWQAVAALPQIDRPLEPDPSHFKGKDRPVEKISWWEAIEFCNRLSRKTGKEYRLPSEAEWEYACRAGTTTPFHFGETIATDLANYRGTDWEYNGTTYPGNYGLGIKGVFREETTPVGSFKVANAFGLLDMHDNVCEWCADHWHENYQGAPSDGSAWLSENDNQMRMLRGGSWYFIPSVCRSAPRHWYDPDNRYGNLGLRVVCAAARTL
ncbi:MAG: formylglycine-generating enzyme family protein [Drouetiella hepatica Uher 2000/2452]|jgi:formylglycine-generating enzyme required for sulfatase activity|uniref:Formylglycine-generating enzyme family protein n=1 Tax=Drouetiella hepatica Uher 2000/2452 TaxID=904376 RepID=A0A951QFU8_9CYAN|nr:formylglycine-generating enzyme family protein [Drouetiella hepatica Uher 2000/2452]